jgi:hypothetical protein
MQNLPPSNLLKKKHKKSCQHCNIKLQSNSPGCSDLKLYFKNLLQLITTSCNSETHFSRITIFQGGYKTSTLDLWKGFILFVIACIKLQIHFVLKTHRCPAASNTLILYFTQSNTSRFTEESTEDDYRKRYNKHFTVRTFNFAAASYK